MNILSTEEKTVDPEVASLLLRQGAVVVGRSHRAQQRNTVGTTQVIALTAAAIKREGLPAVFVAQLVEPLRDFSEDGIPIDRLETSIRTTPQRCRQAVGMVLVKIEP